jgi:transposase
MPKRECRFYLTKYATDLTDAQWATIAPLVTVTLPKGGRPTDSDLQAIVNELLSKIALPANGACFRLIFSQ